MRLNDQEANRLRVLKAIRRAEPVSRSELARLVPLSTATITEIATELVHRSVLLEERSQPVGPGRPRLHLRINPDAARVVGAFLGPDGRLAVEINDLCGRSLTCQSLPLRGARSAKSFVEQIGDLINEGIAASGFDRNDLDSVGVALPAHVDSETGQLHWLQPFEPHPLSAGAILEKRIGLPVVVDNSANVVARAAHWFGEDRQLDDFSLITLGVGTGFARYVDGQIWRGARGANPEFAHVKVGPGGAPRCTCGGRGCLTMYASMGGIVFRVHEARGLLRPEIAAIESHFRQVAAEARAGDPLAKLAFEAGGEALGIAVANHINESDPARVLVLLADAELQDLLTAPFFASLHENVLPVMRGRTPVQLRLDPETRLSQGAAALVLEGLYRRPRAQAPDLDDGHQGGRTRATPGGRAPGPRAGGGAPNS